MKGSRGAWRRSLAHFAPFVLLPFFLAPSCKPRTSSKPTLDPPSSVTATAVTTTRIDLAWGPVAPDATAVEIERTADGGATFTPIATLGPGQVTYSDTGLAPSTEYCYHVRFTRGSSAGAWSALVCASTVVVSSVTTTGVPSPPTSRMGHSAIYDPTGNRMLVFGGLTGAGVTNELWALDLATNTWSQPASTGIPPSPRWGHSAILDSGNNRMIVYGGNDGTPPGNFDDLYAINLATLAWSSVPLLGGLPFPRHDHSAIYDALYQRMVVFGGTDDIGPFDEVWSVDLTISPTMWTQIMITGPFARAEHSAVYDPTGQRMIAFGGQDPSVPGTYFADVWELSLPNPAGIVPLAWSPVSASGGPTARFGHSAVLNGSKMMVFGGDTGTATGEMWQLNLGATSTWNPVTLGSPAPAARLGHRAIFIGATSTMVLFGGGTAPATPAFNDVWEFGM